MRTLLVVVTCAVLSVSATVARSACTSDLDCADQNVCNGAERCQGGVCLPGTPLQCADTSPCTIDSCDPLFGCQHAPVLNGTSCSDGLPCNGAEVCQAGICQPGTPIGEGASCNSGNPCTNNDVCRSGVCVAGTVRPDGASCSDGKPCNGAETCLAGVCKPGAPALNGTSCGDAEPCNGIDTCQGGACVTGTVPAEGSPCSDGFACNGAEVCHAGVCTPGQRPPDGTSCSDGNPCNGAETCEAGICRGGTAPDCDDHNDCTVDSCDKDVGCKHVPRSNGTNCGDHDPCNGQETCQSGVCSPGTPPPAGTACDDGNSCNGIESCQNQKCTAGTPLPDGQSCADANVCNGLETCLHGACVGGNPLQCSDGNPCTTDSCDPTTGCKFTTKPNGSSCDDGNACNGSEVCQGNTCIPGTPLSCPATCDPTAGCVTDELIAGRKLLLRAGNHAGSGTDVKVQTRCQIFTSTPPSHGTGADPVLHGGVLRLRSVTGGFDLRFDLPKANWNYLRAPEDDRGYSYRDRSRFASIHAVIVKDGRLTKIIGGGPDLQASLANDPNPVDVSLIIGNQRYCMSFGGATTFDASRRFLATDAPAPGACPP